MFRLNRLVRFSALGIVLVTAALAARGLRTDPPRAAKRDALAPTAASAGEHRTRLLHSWQDSVKLDGQDVERRVDVVFDYTEGVAHHLTYDIKGNLLSDAAITTNTPQPSLEEIQEAQSLVMADAELSVIVKRTGGVFEGGFVLEEPTGACGLGTRCLQLLLISPDRIGLIRRIVVDLTRQTIPYRDYTPPTQQ